MPEIAKDAFVEKLIGPEQIGLLAVLYDRFAHALDPLSKEVDQAEKTFMEEIATYYDMFRSTDPETARRISQHDFTKAVILRCKRHLRAGDKPSTT